MLKTYLRAASAQMGIPMTAQQAEQFELYHALLTEANARMNLTRVPDDPREAADRNYLDCIAPLAGALPPVRVAVDVGSGAGFPGIPLAIMLPEVRLTLLDAQGKRVAFLQSVIEALGLNARAVHLRAEDAARKPEYREAFDLATARAVAPMNVLAEYLLPFVAPGGVALALKGPGLDEELADAALDVLGGALLRIDTLTIPGRNWQRRAAWLAKVAPIPDKYPRRPGVPEKHPLAGRAVPAADSCRA